MKRAALLALVLFAGCGGSAAPSKPAAAPTAAAAEPVVDAPCRPARVRYTSYPGGDESLATLPWIEGSPREHGLVGLLWYWPPEWQGIRRARVFTGGEAPAGYSAKVLWAFLAPSVRNGGDGKLVIRGENLTGPGRFRDEFSEISYSGQNGAPSFASIIDLPGPGCWRLWLTTGELRAFVDIQAVPPSAITEPPCRPARASGVRAYNLRARVRTGRATKVMWAFPRAKNRGGDELLLVGHNLEGPGQVRDRFAAISYEGQNGVPSYASSVKLPHTGCWRLTVMTAGLQGTVDVRAVGR